MQLSAKIISWLFLPFLTPLYGLLITLYLPVEELTVEAKSMYLLSPQIKRVIFGIFFIFVALAPSISFYTLYRKKLISSIELDEKSERNAPLFIMFAYSVVLFTLFWYKDPEHLLPSYVNSLALTGAVVAFVFVWVNNWTKISLHAAGAGILVGYLIAFSANHVQTPVGPVLISVLLSGIIMSSRFVLKKHTLLQLNLGWFLSAGISFFLNYFYPCV